MLANLAMLCQVFGLTLTDLMENNPKEAGRTIPRVLEFTYDFLTTRCKSPCLNNF